VELKWTNLNPRSLLKLNRFCGFEFIQVFMFSPGPHQMIGRFQVGQCKRFNSAIQ
jgi:hypothetical protein